MMSDGLTHDEMNRELGAKYAETFGSDDELLARQNRWLAENGGAA